MDTSVHSLMADLSMSLWADIGQRHMTHWLYTKAHHIDPWNHLAAAIVAAAAISPNFNFVSTARLKIGLMMRQGLSYMRIRLISRTNPRQHFPLWTFFLIQYVQVKL